MRCSIIKLAALSALTVSSVVAGRGRGRCISDAAANRVAQNFATTFSNFSEEFVNSTYTVDVQDQTDSVKWLISNGTACPNGLGSVTFDSRRALMDAQLTQPNLPFLILNVWHDCTNVIARWKFDIQPQQVQGIAVLGTVCNEGANRRQEPYLINNIYSEFNTGAFLVFQNEFTPTQNCA
ncbi:hypothetical protein BST61_g487 [Cercospora zeina]